MLLLEFQPLVAVELESGQAEVKKQNAAFSKNAAGPLGYLGGLGKDTDKDPCIMMFRISLIFVFTALTASADIETLELRQAGLKSALARVTPSLVSVSDGFGAGSGVVVSGDGIILTASHVVESHRRDIPRIRVKFPDGSEYRAKLLGMYRTADAAMLKITEPYRKGPDFPHVELGNSGELERGEWCFALGHPGGFRQERPAPVRLGRVLSAGYRTVVSDCAIVLGDSGGPLFDLSGRLIGIHSMITEVIVENRHVAIDVFRRDGDQMEDGRQWGKLNSRDDDLVGTEFFGVGIRWRSFVPEINRIDRRSPAYQSGLRIGDVLTSINGQKFADALGLNTLMGLIETGQLIEVQYKRRGEVRTTKVMTGYKPNADELIAHREDRLTNGRIRAEYFREMKNQLTVLRRVGTYEKRSPDELRHFDSVVSGSRNSVVEFQSLGEPLTLGTIVSRDGYILTKASELDDTVDPDCVLADGRRLKIKEVAVDRSFDLALVKVNARNLEPVEWATEPPPAAGRIVVTTDSRGTPMLPGVVSVANRKLKTSNKGFLGVKLTMAGRDQVAVLEVIPGGAAQRHGIRSKDIIVAINDRTISNIPDMIDLVSNIRPNATISMLLRRNGRLKTIDAVLSPRFLAENNEVMLDRYRETENLGKFASIHNSGFPEAMQHDTDLFPSQCGGPLFDISGKAIGLNIARSARVVSYAIPAHAVQRVYEELRKKGERQG